MPSKYKIHAALLSVGLIYGANYNIAMVVMPEYIGAFGIILVRVVSGTFLFFILGLLSGNEKIVYRRDYLKLAGLSILGVAVNQLMFFKGLSLTTPISASVIMTVSPIIVLIVSYFVLKERITMNKLIGIGLGATGAILLIGVNKFSVNNSTFLGNLFVFINAASFSTYLVLVKPLMLRYKPITVIKWVFLFGTIFVIPFGYPEIVLVDWAHMPSEAWLALGYIVVGTTFLAYLLNTWALQNVNPSVVGYYIYVQPVFSTFVAITFRGDVLTMDEIFYAGLIFAGVYFVSIRKSNLRPN